MSGDVLKAANIMSKLSSSLLIIVLIAIIVLIIAVVYIIFLEKRNSSWLNKRESDIKASYSLKKIPFLYAIQTRIANKFAITNTGTRQENEKYALYVIAFISIVAIFIICGLWQFVDKYPYGILLLIPIGIVIPWTLFDIYYEAQLAKMIKLNELLMKLQKARRCRHG